MKRIAIIGAGTWGTALAIMAARAGHHVIIWSRRSRIAESINDDSINPEYLSRWPLPDGVVATTDLAEALGSCELMIFASPSHAARELFAHIKPTLNKRTLVVSVAKGIEIESSKRISEVALEVLGEECFADFVCLSGPSFAKEVVANHPTAIVAASRNLEAARTVQAELSHDNLRIYTNTDVVGTELGGSVKNVMAIAAGMTTGLGYGSNSLAALITRGLAEITRLALSQGALVQTIMGLAGVGDLVLTCTGTLSRNRFVGEELGKGKTLAEITREMNEVAEGIKTSTAVKQLAKRAGVEMPITDQVHAVLHEGKSAHAAMKELMARPLRQETY